MPSFAAISNIFALFSHTNYWYTKSRFHTSYQYDEIFSSKKGIQVYLFFNMKSSDNPVFSQIPQILEESVTHFPLKPAFTVKEEGGKLYNISYKRFHKDVILLSNAINSFLKFKRCNIALSMKNCYKWCVSYFSIIASNNVCVPLDKDLIKEELLHLIEFGNIRAIFADEKVTSQLLSLKEKLPEDFLIITTGNLMGENIINFDDMLSLQKNNTLLPNYKELTKQINQDETAVILFTSGTTGLAKGVMLSNKNICSNVNAARLIANISENDSTLCILPLHHAYQTIITLTLLSKGGSVSFCENIRHTNSDLILYKPTIFVTVPLMLEKIHKKILKEADRKGALARSLTSKKTLSLVSKIKSFDIKKLLFRSVHELLGGNIRMIITGAAMMNADIANDYNSFAIPVIIGYGLTECSPLAICNTAFDIRSDSVGKPILNAEVKILNPDSNGIGEILIKGPMVMKGYYKNEAETKKVLKDGWLHTGDLGYCDSDGYYHISGRIKNVIVTKNGKNIYPEEIEYYLNQSPYIKESMVFSQNKEEETVCANIVYDEETIKKHLKKEKISDEEIKKVIDDEVKKTNSKIASYKKIKDYFLSKDELKKTATHKIIRNIKNKNE